MKTFFSAKLAVIAAVVVTIALAVTGLALIPSSVFAQGTGPTDATATPAAPSANASVDKKGSPARLFKREQRAAKVQERNLDRATVAADKAQTLIEKAKENGKDVAALESALAAFKTAVEEAKGFNAQASEILSTHAGFDASGKVTDPAAALKTVEDAGKALKDARTALKGAGTDFREALKNWRAANPRPTKTPKP
jgi:hypothetical protein